MEENIYKFGSIFKKIVDEHNLKRIQIAHVLGCSPNYITMIIKGRRLPSIELLQKFCIYFNLSPNDMSILFQANIEEADDISINIPENSDYKYLLAEIIQMMCLEPKTNPKITYTETIDLENAIHHLAQKVISREEKNLIYKMITIPPSEKHPYVSFEKSNVIQTI